MPDSLLETACANRKAALANLDDRKTPVTRPAASAKKTQPKRRSKTKPYFSSRRPEKETEDCAA